MWTQKAPFIILSLLFSRCHVFSEIVGAATNKIKFLLPELLECGMPYWIEDWTLPRVKVEGPPSTSC